MNNFTKSKKLYYSELLLDEGENRKAGIFKVTLLLGDVLWVAGA
jgi:hypothetical protein